MDNDWLMQEGMIRLGMTLSLIILFIALEALYPRKARSGSRQERWLGNGVIQLLNAVMGRLFLPWLAPLAVAIEVDRAGAGLLNLSGMPDWLVLLSSLLILDLAIYWQHRWMHRVNGLWRLHRMHHTDIDVDVTTALRFHPFEILLSTAYKSLLVWLLGIPAGAVLLFAVLLNGMALFNHANLMLPAWLDRTMRLILVTPDMHRVHHSVNPAEHNRNFGFNLSCWDRWFGSYLDQPEKGHDNMELGLDETNGQKTGSVIWMLKQPFA